MSSRHPRTATGIAVAAALILLLGALPRSARAQVSTPNVTISQPSAGADAKTVYSITFTTGPNGGGATSITIVFPATTDLSKIANSNVLDPNGRSIGDCTNGVNNVQHTVVCAINTVVAPGETLTVVLGGVVNPPTAGNQTLTVQTNGAGDNEPITSTPYTVQPAHQISQPTFTQSTTTPGATGVTDTISFVTSSTGGLSEPAASQITIVFPAGTGLNNLTATKVFDGNGRLVGDCTNGVNTANHSITCNFAGGQGIAASSPATVELDGVTNPPAPGPVSVSTTSDTTPVSSNTPSSATAPAASAGAPSSKSSTGATLAGTANPNGLPTTAFWEYGLDPAYRGPGFSGPVFDQSTTSQSIGSGVTSQPVAAVIGNLVPNALYHARLVATNSDGTTTSNEITFLTLKAPAPPAPLLGKSENFTPSGTVFVFLHGHFVRLTQSLQLPTGTVFDTLRGSVSVVAASGGAGGASDAKAKKAKKPTRFTGTFGGAVFKVTQARSGPNKGLTTLTLMEGTAGVPAYSSCKAKRSADSAHTALSSRILSRLRSRSSGRFRTRGRYAAGTVRGTKWTTTDRCDGTLIAVQQHSVLVTDLVKHTTILVRAGHHYLAKAPTRKHK
jgi:hypothetical protein